MPPFKYMLLTGQQTRMSYPGIYDLLFWFTALSNCLSQSYDNSCQLPSTQ